MLTQTSIRMPAAVLTAVLLAACGGGGGDGVAGDPLVPPDIGQNVAAVFAYIGSVVGVTSETSDPITIDAISLAVDDTIDPAPL